MAHTTTFALEVSGKTYRLDETGNQKAIKALKRSRRPLRRSCRAAEPVNAKISGTKDGEILKVDSIEVQ